MKIVKLVQSLCKKKTENMSQEESSPCETSVGPEQMHGQEQTFVLTLEQLQAYAMQFHLQILQAQEISKCVHMHHNPYGVLPSFD